jgi:outer membrane autotransporter protein
VGAGTGTRQINFDNAIVRALASNATFIGGAQNQLNIAAGGLTIDSNGFAVGTLGFSGVGGLTKIGAGTLSLRAGSIFTGETVIQEGTLALVAAGTNALATSSRVVANATFDISAINGTASNIQSLAGTGAVTLGAKTLAVTNANDLFSGIISGTGGLTVSGGTQTLSGANTYNGATTVSGGMLRAGAAGAFSAASAYATLAGGTLDLAGFNQTLASLDNAGAVNLGGAPGAVLTIAGNYVGSGGTLHLNTVLGGDGSVTDRVVVQGSTAGLSTLSITNVGGTGAQTVEGIKVVDVVGASNGSFALQGDYVIQGQQAVVGGAYAYTLQKNGIATPGDGDWYLRSSLINPAGGAAPPAGPLYQAGVPLYENYAQVLLGMNELPTLQQRVGNRYWGGSDAMARAGLTPAPGDGSATPSAFWGRVEGGHADLQPSNTTGSTYSTDQMKVQVGLDGLALENERGRLIVGLTAQYGLTTANVTSFFGNGQIHVGATGVGGTLTWYGDNGFYVDGQAQSTIYRSDLSSALANSLTHGNEGSGYAFSVESGKRIAAGNGWSLTPQAQLSYSKVDFDSFADRFGALVSLRDADSLLGRAGLALNHQKIWNDGMGTVRADIYGIANLRYEFLNGTSVDVAGTSFANANDRLWGSIGGGGTYSWANGRYAIFGEVSYNASLNDSSNNRSYKGTGGFRVIW